MKNQIKENQIESAKFLMPLSTDKLTISQIETYCQQLSENFKTPLTIKTIQRGCVGVQIQCKHFKSRKCRFRVKFREQNQGQNLHEKLYKLNSINFKHENHKTDLEDNFELAKAKQWLQEQIETIRDCCMKMSNYDQSKIINIKPSKVRVELKKQYSLDIYQFITKKDQKKYMKKKLDNIIQQVRQGDIFASQQKEVICHDFESSQNQESWKETQDSEDVVVEGSQIQEIQQIDQGLNFDFQNITQFVEEKKIFQDQTLCGQFCDNQFFGFGEEEVYQSSTDCSELGASNKNGWENFFNDDKQQVQGWQFADW